MQVDLQKILSITGHPGLYRYLSQARQGVIVENLIDGKRMRVPPTAKISTMSDITIFTNSDEDLMLIDVFRKIKDKTNGEQALSHKSSTEELMRYFEEIIPEYRKDKVFPSHVRKIIEWYNVLQEQGFLDFDDNGENEAEDSENEAESSESEVEVENKVTEVESSENEDENKVTEVESSESEDAGKDE